jgi:hypothetical protein
LDRRDLQERLAGRERHRRLHHPAAQQGEEQGTDRQAEPRAGGVQVRAERIGDEAGSRGAQRSRGHVEAAVDQLAAPRDLRDGERDGGDQNEPGRREQDEADDQRGFHAVDPDPRAAESHHEAGALDDDDERAGDEQIYRRWPCT